MKIVITGGAGFIGSHITEALVALGHEVTVYDNLSSGFERNLEPFRQKIEFIHGDVRDAGRLKQATKGAQVIFHEAALVSVTDSVKNPRLNHDININGTFEVLEAARNNRVGRVVMASSAAVYGNNPDLPKKESMMPEPESPYGMAKLSGEHYAKVYASLYGVKTVALRYFNVYGPRQDPSSMYSGVISRFANCFKSGQIPTIFGDGLQSRDFVYVADVVQANLLSMETEASHSILNVGTGKSVSLKDLLKTMGDVWGRSLEPVYQPQRAGDIKHSCADISGIKTKLAYVPKYSLNEGLTLTSERFAL